MSEILNLSFRGVKNNPTEKIRKVENRFRNMNLDIGDYKWSASSDDFNGWLRCDGRSLSRTDYFELFHVIGTSFGSDDISTFKIPDMRGRVLGGVGNSGNVGDATHALGHSVGVENVTLNNTQIPSHSHTGTSNASLTGITSSGTTNNGTTGISVNSVLGHSHTYQDAYFAENVGGGGGNYGTSAGTDNDNSFVWRTAEGGNSTTPQDINTGTSGAHTHSITDSGHTHTFTANITDPTHTHTFTTGNTGGGGSHINIQPTLYAGNLFIYSKYTPDII
jgi:microcystin-dependent protein